MELFYWHLLLSPERTIYLRRVMESQIFTLYKSLILANPTPWINDEKWRFFFLLEYIIFLVWFYPHFVIFIIFYGEKPILKCSCPLGEGFLLLNVRIVFYRVPGFTTPLLRVWTQFAKILLIFRFYRRIDLLPINTAYRR